MARCFAEDAWLCGLAASFFDSKLVDLLVRWLMHALEDNLHDAEFPEHLDTSKGEWPEEPLGSFDFHCPAAHAAHATGIPQWHVRARFLPTLWRYQVWVRNGDFGVAFKYHPEGGPENRNHTMEGLEIHVKSRPGCTAAAYLALAHMVVCKGLEDAPSTRLYSRQITQPSLGLPTGEVGTDGCWVFEPCRWSDAQSKFACVQTSRALAVMQWWNRHDGKAVIRPLDVKVDLRPT